MTTMDNWPVEISLHEDDGKTRAEARLTKQGIGGIGHGLARRNPDDQEVTQIGERIAAARALSDLAHQLLSNAAGQIEELTHERTHLSLLVARPDTEIETAQLDRFFSNNYRVPSAVCVTTGW